MHCLFLWIAFISGKPLPLADATKCGSFCEWYLVRFSLKGIHKVRNGQSNSFNVSIMAFTLIFALILLPLGACGAEPIEKAVARTEPRASERNVGWLESELGSAPIGTHFNHLQKPILPLEFTPPSPKDVNCSWDIPLDDDETSNTAKKRNIMCSYQSADGFIYEIEGEEVLGIELKPNANGNWSRRLPFGIISSDTPDRVFEKLTKIGINSELYEYDETHRFRYGIGLYEDRSEIKSLFFGFDKEKRLTQIYISAGERNY